MAFNNFIPEVWSAQIQMQLEKRLVFQALANTQYEGEIAAYGDTVHILSFGDPTIKTYTRNTDIDTPEELDDAQQLLVIDKAKYFNFAIDDVDRAQMRVQVMAQATERAAYGLAEAVDREVAALHVQASAANLIGTTASPESITTADEAYEYIVDLGTQLNEANVPMAGRWVVVPPWFYALAQKDARFTDASASGTTATLREGEVGRAAGFEVFMSNNVANTAGSAYKIMAGTRDAITMATQVVEVEAYRPERRFADAIKGLVVYGMKVVRPEFMAVLTANNS